MTKASSNANNKNSFHTLAITRQTSLEVENFCQNGQQKRLHYVIKNNPFLIEVEIERSETNVHVKELDFESVTLEASLLYDCGEDKKVACLKVQPLSYKGIIKEGDSKTCVLELTIGVLSSQHEDMNFKVLIQAVDTSANTKIHNLCISSEPIQVISKPDVLRKKKLPSTPRKATANTAIMDKLYSIEQALARIEQSTSNHSPTATPSANSSDLPIVRTEKSLGGKRKLTPQENFESAFFTLLEAHANLPQSDRPLKIQKLIGDCSSSQKSTFEEIISSASTALNRSKFLAQQSINPLDMTVSAIEISDEFMSSLYFSEILKDFL